LASTGARLRTNPPTKGIWCEAGANERKNEMICFVLGVLAYLVPTFVLGFVWHLILFDHYYAALAIYRKDIIIPFGLLSMLIQAVMFAWIYDTAFAHRNRPVLLRALTYGAFGAVLSWRFTPLAVAAKNVLRLIASYLVIQ